MSDDETPQLKGRAAIDHAQKLAMDRMRAELAELRGQVAKLQTVTGAAERPPIAEHADPYMPQGHRQFSSAGNQGYEDDPTHDPDYLRIACAYGPGSNEAHAALASVARRYASDVSRQARVAEGARLLDQQRADGARPLRDILRIGPGADMGPAETGQQQERLLSPWEDDPLHRPEVVRKLGVHTAPAPLPFNPETAVGMFPGRTPVWAAERGDYPQGAAPPLSRTPQPPVAPAVGTGPRTDFPAHAVQLSAADSTDVWATDPGEPQ